MLKAQASVKEKTAFITHLEKQLEESKTSIENEVNFQTCVVILFSYEIFHVNVKILKIC